MAQFLEAGDQIDKYRVERCLGVGGMGEVYLVTHIFLNVRRALKLLRLELTEDDPTFRDRFVREARIAARFKHPNSIDVVDVESESESGFLYLVMEYVDGQSLHQYLQNGGLPEDQLLYVCREVARALDAAWKEVKLVHRDIKPGNIMISRDGDVKLADLGIAKSSSGGSGMTMALTMEGTMIGTPEYASPEQCRDASHVDTRADIYSLGATMYEMLTGSRPFHGANAFDTVAKVLQEPLVPVRERNPEVSEETAALVERMMAKDPSDRPQTMGELIALIDTVLKFEDDSASPIQTDVEVLIHEQAEEAADKITAVQSQKVRKAYRFEYTVLFILCLLTFISIGVLYSDRNARERELFHIGDSIRKEMQAEKAAHDKNVERWNQTLKIPGILLDRNSFSLLNFSPGNPEKDYTIPIGITRIAKAAFVRCHNLENVVCPDSVKWIEAGAFLDCASLKTVSVSASCHVAVQAIPEHVKLVRRGR